MAFLRILLIVLSSVLGLSSCAYVDTLQKCQVGDDDCQKHLFESVLNDISKTGIPELDIPPIDPVKLNNLVVSIPDVVEMTIPEGTAKGVRHCRVEKFHFDYKTFHASIVLRCNITIKAKYKIHTSAPIIKTLFGNDIHGEGNGKAKIVNIVVDIHFPFEIEKRGSETFLKADINQFKYTYDIQDKVVFDADHLILGDKESSKEIIALINSSWKVIIDDFGTHFFKVAMNIVMEFCQKFFNNVSIEHYILGDVTQYIH